MESSSLNAHLFVQKVCLVPFVLQTFLSLLIVHTQYPGSDVLQIHTAHTLSYSIGIVDDIANDAVLLRVQDFIIIKSHLTDLVCATHVVL